MHSIQIQVMVCFLTIRSIGSQLIIVQRGKGSTLSSVLLISPLTFSPCFFPQEEEINQASIFTGEEEVFAFERTMSRLKEMQGEEYWSTDRVSQSPGSARQ